MDILWGIFWRLVLIFLMGIGITAMGWVIKEFLYPFWKTVRGENDSK